jgi:hypothetical protein
MIATLEKALKDAGWDAIVEAGPHGLEIVTEQDRMSVDIADMDGEVTWWDFTHVTVLGSTYHPESLTETLKQLLPLRNEALMEWIGHREEKQRHIVTIGSEVRECRLIGTEYVHVLNSSFRIHQDDAKITGHREVNQTTATK